MWSLRQRDDESFYLTFDRDRRFTNKLRGLWELVGRRDSVETNKAIAENQKWGYTHVNDDEGNVRVLVLME